MTELKTPPLFTTRFSQGSRTFFFDVKKSKNDKPYLRITTSSIKGEEKKRSFMTIFDSEVPEFCQAVADATSFITSA
jgi:hypothetical protein